VKRDVILFVLTWVSLSVGANAQTAPRKCATATAMSSEAGSESAFIECARRGAAKYEDQAAAILDGYRLIGQDFPGMGEHWINISILFDGIFDPERPEVLSYIEVGGAPQLLGVAYAIPLLPGERAPEWPWPEAWHAHYRTLDDETMLPEHHLPGGVPDRARIAMLHTWIWAENPAGTFAADNWAIPYVRLGLSPPAGAPQAAARALSLVSGGSDYFKEAIARVATPTPTNIRRIEIAFDSAEGEVGVLLGDSAPGTLTTDDTSRLSEIWNRLWNTVDSSVDSASRPRLTELGLGSH
jgi:hypothetical protein